MEDMHEADDRIEFQAKAYFIVDALRALAPLCAKTLIAVTVQANTVRLEASTKGLGGVVTLHAESTTPGTFVLPASYVDQIAKVFPSKDYAAGGLLTVYCEGDILTFRDVFGKQLELNDVEYRRIDEPASVTLDNLLDEYGHSGGEEHILMDPDRVRVITSVSKLLFGDIVMRQPGPQTPTFVSIGQSFAGYIREPGWHDGKDDLDNDDTTKVTVLPGQSDIFTEIGGD